MTHKVVSTLRAILVDDCFRMRLDLVDLEQFDPYARFELDINTRLPLSDLNGDQ
jgi:hypothetical protein